MVIYHARKPTKITFNKHIQVKWGITRWWFQPIWKIFVKLGIFPKTGENKTCLKPPLRLIIFNYLFSKKKFRWFSHLYNTFVSTCPFELRLEVQNEPQETWGSRSGKSHRMGTFHLEDPNLFLTQGHGNPQPSFLGGITHILGMKTLIFHGFGVEVGLVNMTNPNNALKLERTSTKKNHTNWSVCSRLPYMRSTPQKVWSTWMY